MPDQLEDAPIIKRGTSLSLVFIGFVLLMLVLLFLFIPHFQQAISTVIDPDGRSWWYWRGMRLCAVLFTLLMSCVFSGAGAGYGRGHARWLGVTVLVLGVIPLAVLWIAASVIS